MIAEVEPVKDTDTIRLYFPEPNEPKDHLDFVEQKFIKLFRPQYNTQHNEMTYEERLEVGQLPDVQNKLPSKEDLAKVLFSEMPEHGLVVEARNCTDEELARILEYERDWQSKFSRWKKLK